MSHSFIVLTSFVTSITAERCIGARAVGKTKNSSVISGN